MYFLECMQHAAIGLWDDRDPWTWAGRKRQRHRDLGELHDRDRPRPERLEAIVSVLQCLLRFVQVKDNLRVLHPKKREGIPIASDDDESLASLTGMSRDRCKGAIADLKSCGFIGAKPQKNDVGNRSRASIRWITYRLIRTLKCWRQFARLCKRIGRSVPTAPPDGAAGAARLVVTRATERRNL
jgi:hypothetical protein